MQNVLEIIKWYKKNFRDVPWRKTNDPYKIWLSEVILQQTRVNQGLAYYEAFVSEFPDIRRLARAGEEKVLKLWQGLGYYSRARNLLRTARIVTDQYQGNFPSDFPSLLLLPGIGEYTASAILSFAYKQPYPTLDGNVYRVISRIYDIHLPVDDAANRKVFINILNQMIQGEDPGEFNNAMMELGALICKPGQPLCQECPVNRTCLSRINGTFSLLPVKRVKSKRRTRYFHFICIRYKNKFYLEKRKDGDIWKHLYQFPLIESEAFLNKKKLKQLIGEEILSGMEFSIQRQEIYKHQLTHQEIQAQFTELEVRIKPVFLRTGLIEVDIVRRHKYPVPVLVDKFLLSL